MLAAVVFIGQVYFLGRRVITQPRVADADAADVAAQVGVDYFGVDRRGLLVDHPARGVEARRQDAEGLVVDGFVRPGHPLL